MPMPTIRQSRTPGDSEHPLAGVPRAADPESIDHITSLVEQAEAEAADAEAAATAARTRLAELRTARTTDDTEEADSRPGGDDGGDDDSPTSPSKRRRWRHPSAATTLTSVAVVAASALLGASGYLYWQHQNVEREQQRRAEFAAAAGQAVVTLMSINSSTVQDDVQRIIDNSTGAFRDDFRQSAEEFVEVAKESKAVTKATVVGTAVEAMTHDSAVVLVTAATTITNSAGANEQPRTWRLSVDVTNDAGHIKMSKVDFVP
jgi:Mce-associated membrane protein